MVELTNAIPTREASSPSSWHELRVRATMWVVFEADYAIKLLVITSGKREIIRTF
jgi:hypothetical protein